MMDSKYPCTEEKIRASKVRTILFADGQYHHSQTRQSVDYPELIRIDLIPKKKRAGIKSTVTYTVNDREVENDPKAIVEAINAHWRKRNGFHKAGQQTKSKQGAKKKG